MFQTYFELNLLSSKIKGGMHIKTDFLNTRWCRPIHEKKGLAHKLLKKNFRSEPGNSQEFQQNKGLLERQRSV